MNTQEVKERSQAIEERAKAIIRETGARAVMAYVGVRNEVETGGLIRSLLAGGLRVSVPLCIRETKDLVPCEIKDMEEDLEIGTFGIPEPKEERRRPLAPEELEVVLVPGVAFDRLGYRLGHGTGYYDRFLSKLYPGTRKVGLAYDWQVVEELPRASHDVPVDSVVTETQVVDVRARNLSVPHESER